MRLLRAKVSVCCINASGVVCSNLDVRGASCLAYQRQFEVEETSRDLAFFAADQLAIWHISESTKYRGVSDALSSTYSHTLNGKDPVVIWVHL